MGLTAGTRLGLYDVVSLIGAGGMGEVYRAKDTKLHRDVALKILPELFTSDADRLARFRREAQVLASLNHPNIAAIYGFEDSGATHALVMELVDGPTLAESMAGGQPGSARRRLSIDDALPIARQIAEALEAAHEQGIIHRDLKPANIKVRPDGTVKVLDFGLAKALAPATGSSAAAEAMNAPTLTSPAMTQAGMILGTAAYMSPEQARGRAVDRRADIWAFGVVLYEMLSGSRAFGGDDVSTTIANVLKEDVRWDRLPADLPAALQRLLRRCLDKDPKRRLRDIGEARVQIEDVMRGAGDASSVAARGESSRPVPIHVPAGSSVRANLAWAALVVAAGVLAPMAVKWLAAPPPEPAVSRFELDLPARTLEFGWPEISPDGRRMAVIAEGDDRIRRIWTRSLDDVTFHALAGTEGASYPFWSPNSQSVAFFADDTLKKIPISGGPPQPLCTATRARGGTWGRAGVVLFSASVDNVEQLNQVVETGGNVSTGPPPR